MFRIFLFSAESLPLNLPLVGLLAPRWLTSTVRFSFPSLAAEWF